MNKEQIYDQQIAPLMTQIIEICQKNGIAMIASFDITTDVDGNLTCTTCLPDQNGKSAPGHIEALGLLRNQRKVMRLRTNHADGSATMSAILA